MKTIPFNKVKDKFIGPEGSPSRTAYEAKLAKETGPKMKPILFSTPMVQAILDGRKTQTRREMKIQPTLRNSLLLIDNTIPVWKFQFAKDDHGRNHGEADSIPFKSPYQPGDILYVRETFVYRPKHGKYYFKADYPDFEPYAHGGWKPSIHMPKSAARIFLKVTSVKAERLQDITEADAIAEGVEPYKDGYKDYRDTPTLFSTDTAKGSFVTLWRSIHDWGEEAKWWQSNPWVFAYTFERIDNPNQSPITNH